MCLAESAWKTTTPDVVFIVISYIFLYVIPIWETSQFWYCERRLSIVFYFCFICVDGVRHLFLFFLFRFFQIQSTEFGFCPKVWTTPFHLTAHALFTAWVCPLPRGVRKVLNKDSREPKCPAASPGDIGRDPVLFRRLLDLISQSRRVTWQLVANHSVRRIGQTGPAQETVRAYNKEKTSNVAVNFFI